MNNYTYRLNNIHVLSFDIALFTTSYPHSLTAEIEGALDEAIEHFMSLVIGQGIKETFAEVTAPNGMACVEISGTFADPVKIS